MQPNSELAERTAQISAHRACCGSEHDPLNGKLHGYCIVCGIPWPCEYAGTPLICAFAEEGLASRERIATLEQRLASYKVSEENLAQALFPESFNDPDLKQSDLAEFDLDAMGACQIISRIKAELTAAKERIGAMRKVLGDATSILRIALAGMPNGAFRNAVLEEEMPRFERAAKQDGGTKP